MADFFCKLPQLFHQVVVPLHANARRHTDNWTAVYGCTSDRLWISPNLALSVLFLTASLRSTWLANDRRRYCWSKLSPLGYRHDSSVFTMEYKPWYHCGANAKMVVVTMLRSDVYCLLHMCHVLIKVTIIFWHECVYYLVFWKFMVYTLQSEQVSS
jgi:hypothetical protein